MGSTNLCPERLTQNPSCLGVHKDVLFKESHTNPCFTGLCGSRLGTHACDLATVLKLNGKVT